LLYGARLLPLLPDLVTENVRKGLVAPGRRWYAWKVLESKSGIVSTARAQEKLKEKSLPKQVSPRETTRKVAERLRRKAAAVTKPSFVGLFIIIIMIIMHDQVLLCRGSETGRRGVAVTRQCHHTTVMVDRKEFLD
jgi:hypothetical protein